MFSENELKDYCEQFLRIGLTDEAEQKEILEFFYTLGKIIYDININSCGKEKS